MESRLYRSEENHRNIEIVDFLLGLSAKQEAYLAQIQFNTSIMFYLSILLNFL